MVNNQAIITLGGKGTRLKSVTNGVPKPLYPIDGMCALERAIKILNKQGILKFIFFINFLPELFEQYTQILLRKYEIEIEVIIENEPKGEAGSIFDCIDILESQFLFINGDIVFDIDLKKFNDYHLSKQSEITIMTHLTSHPEDSDCIIENPSFSIADYKFKNLHTNKSFFLGNAGLAIAQKEVIISLKNIKINI